MDVLRRVVADLTLLACLTAAPAGWAAAPEPSGAPGAAAPANPADGKGAESHGKHEPEAKVPKLSPIKPRDNGTPAIIQEELPKVPAVKAPVVKII